MKSLSRREFLAWMAAAAAAPALPGCARAQRDRPAARRPNILYIMSDDHAAHAIGAYGSRINQTPHLDRIARGGMRFDNCFCTNSLCGPSRAVLLTGKFSHKNGFFQNGNVFDGSQQTFPKLLQQAGYQTAVVGKWHLESDPTGFDYWNVLPGQGVYHDPVLIEMGRKEKHPGYVTDIITDLSLDWLRRRDKNRPFCLLCHHKAPHRAWDPDAKHAAMYNEADIPEPETFNDDYAGRSAAAGAATMRVDRDLDARDTKGEPPAGLDGQALKQWKYQRYIKDYLRCIASVDDNVGRLLDYLDAEGLAQDTIVVYTSDQGFFLGDHGWFDKRFIYEESLRMPYLVRYPREIRPGTVCDALAQNIDFAPTFLDYAGVAAPADIDGTSLRPLYQGRTPPDWREAVYYHYYEYPAVHSVKRHYGIRTKRHKLVHFYYDIDAWELFDLEKDPHELRSVYDDPAYADVRARLETELKRLRQRYGDSDELALTMMGGGAAKPSTGPQLVLALDEPDGAAEALDASGGRRHLAYHGTASAPGRAGKARRFNGTSDYLDLARARCPRPRQTPVTVSAWIRPSKSDGVILAHGGASWGYVLHLADGRPAFSTRVAETLTTVAAAERLPDGWVHVAGQLAAGGAMRLFVGGKPVASAKAPALLAQDPNDNLQVGVDRGSLIASKADAFYGGLLEGVRVDYGDRTDAEVAAAAAG